MDIENIFQKLLSYYWWCKNIFIFWFNNFITKFFKTTVFLKLWIYTFIFMILKIESVFGSSSSSNFYGMENMSPRVVHTKQTQFQGFLGPGNIRKNSAFQSDPFSYRSYGHPFVEIFKGIPYANPPLDGLRYESPAPYPFNSSEVYTANVIKSACPRFGNETEGPSTSYQIKDVARLLNKINLEDCLYLDIYIPMNIRKETNHGLPVLVFANSQSDDNNPFDGSSMATIGNIIVISFRYRVGVLGFLQPGYSNDVRSNFGLWDQLAALQWVRENIKEFGGDENNICLMASDLDAALAGVLAFSRMSQAYGGLFHRVILLNSSPFSPTSLHPKPFITTIHLARALGCPFYEKDGELLSCLRKQPVTKLLSAAQNIGIEDLEYPFVPGLDGTIVQHDLSSLGFGGTFTNSIQELLGRFDLLCGLGEGAVLPNSGRFMWQNIELDRFVTAAIKLILKLEPGIKPSGNLRQDVIRAIQNEYDDRPLMRELISDFLVVNPMIQLLDAHSETGKNTFFYVSKDYDPLHKGKHNELSYIFTSQIYKWKYIDLGQPNLDLEPFDVFISLISNFVKTGDPNVSNQGDRASNQVKPWPKYKKSQGRYLSFGKEADQKSKYRRKQTDFWSQVFPAILKPFMKHTNENDYPNNEVNNWQIKNSNNNNNVPPFIGSGSGSGRGKPFYPNVTYIYPTIRDSPDLTQTTSTMTQSTVVLIGCLLLLLNFLCFMGLFYQRERLKKTELQLRKRFLQNEEQQEEHHHQQQQQQHQQRLGTIEQTLELDSQESGPYMARNNTISFPHPNQHIPLSLDAMSETETDNGFGPDFLGPNYDPKTKVSRWMYQHNNQNRDSSFESPTMMTTSNPMTPIPSSSIPMHIDVRSLQRRPEGSNLLTMAPHIPEFAPILPYQTPFQPNFSCSDIPYADSRATSPTISNVYDVRTPPPSIALNNNLSNINFNNNQRRNPQNIEQQQQSQSPSSIDEFPKQTPPNRSSIIIPLRNSIIIRELDPDDSVESSEPKLVPVKTGTLTRSVGVGSSNHNNDTLSTSTNTIENNDDQVIVNSNSGENVPSTTTTNPMTMSSRHPHSHHQGTTQYKVTFADGL